MLIERNACLGREVLVMGSPWAADSQHRELAQAMRRATSTAAMASLLLSTPVKRAGLCGSPPLPVCAPLTEPKSNCTQPCSQPPPCHPTPLHFLQALSNTLWGLSKLGIQADELMRGIGTQARSRLPEFNSQNLANSVSCRAPRRPSPPLPAHPRPAFLVPPLPSPLLLARLNTTGWISLGAGHWEESSRGTLL